MSLESHRLVVPKSRLEIYIYHQSTSLAKYSSQYIKCGSFLGSFWSVECFAGYCKEVKHFSLLEGPHVLKNAYNYCGSSSKHDLASQLKKSFPKHERVNNLLYQGKYEITSNIHSQFYCENQPLSLTSFFSMNILCCETYLMLRK